MNQTDDLPIQFIQKRARLTNFRARIAATGIKLIKNPYVVIGVIPTSTGTKESVIWPYSPVTLEQANKIVRDMRKEFPKNIYYKAKLERCMK